MNVFGLVVKKEHLYKNILESLQVAVYTCDKHGYITFFNKAAAELWGQEPQIGRHIWSGAWKIYDLNGERLIPEACPMAISVNMGKATGQKEIIIERPDGSRKIVVSNPQLFFDEEGEVNGGMNMLFDIELASILSEEKEQQESK